MTKGVMTGVGGFVARYLARALVSAGDYSGGSGRALIPSVAARLLACKASTEQAIGTQPKIPLRGTVGWMVEKAA
jgi:GDP-D-mannose dehydratase